MAQELSVEEWIEILNDPEVTRPENLDIFKAIYFHNNQRVAASELVLDFSSKYKNRVRPVNFHISISAYISRIKKKYNLERMIKKEIRNDIWNSHFGERVKEGGRFMWTLKPALAAALEQGGFVGAPPAASPDEISLEIEKTLIEGAKKQVVVNAYERNETARAACIAHHKPVCAVCDFDFAKRYGPHGAGFIHVHHLKPLSEIGASYAVDPIKDLRPVCPNCHAMIHHKGGLLSIEALKAMLT